MRETSHLLGNLFQCLITCIIRNLFFIFIWDFLCLSSCPLPLVPLPSTAEQSLVCPVTPPCRHWQTLMRLLSVALPQAEQAQLPQPFLKSEVVLSPHHFNYLLVIGLHVPQGTPGSQTACCLLGPSVLLPRPALQPPAWFPALS